MTTNKRWRPILLEFDCLQRPVHVGASDLAAQMLR
jgi:hypothetical protein